MFAGLLALAMLIMKAFPETPTARALMLYLVELPLRMAGQIERKHIILLAIILFAGQSLALIGSAELALAYAVDLSIYYDAVIATSLAAASARLKSAWLFVKTRFIRLTGPLTRARRPRRPKTGDSRRRAANDDEDPRWLVEAA